MRHVYVALALVVAGLVQPRHTRANPETPYLSDARSVAMAGAGVASNDYPSSIWQNPAGLSAVRRLTLTATLLPLLVRYQAPLPDQTTGQSEAKKTPWQYGGLSVFAAGYRVHELIALGVALYVFSGTGIRFNDLVGDLDAAVTAFAGELQLPVAVNITRNLSIAASYRMTYARVDGELPVPTMGPMATFAEQKSALKGWDFAGFAFGVRYRFNRYARAGLAYRTKVVVDLDGSSKTSAGGETQKLPATGEYALPHTFRLGGELRLLERRLVLVTDFNVWLYEDSHPRAPEQGRAAAWNNAVRGNLGAEYAVREQVFVRAGFYLGNSATSKGAATLLGIGPGLVYGFSTGAGVVLRDAMELDFTLAFSGGAKTTVSEADNPSAAGVYAAYGLFLGISLNYEILRPDTWPTASLR